ncbi:type 2 lantipeptide synthetase LanM family protein [Clostridium sp. FP2]|uniref:type 2 lanthipeptide synthetase LanM family protein n=1 Tax=Clostridium sp. FP2 TaxID=2724481 RepID=UPI0013E92CD7|nr:type 2 lanthipeptide synthetase LanM family protein [Clostridium sp. FP2]MBZ9626043.1 type 2 lantipeptide synthetase LanM family protein [Clostridium sp. FP2]
MEKLNDHIKYWITLFPEIKNENQKLMSIYNDCTLKNMNEDILIPCKLLTLIETTYSQEFLNIIERLKKTHDMPFVEIFMPIINIKYNIIVKDLKKYSFFQNKDKMISEFVYCLYSEVYKKAFRICIQELNIAKINGKLNGESKEEEFNYYTLNLLSNKNYLLYFYNEYPNLWSELMTRATYLSDFIIQIINHIDSDKKDLIDLFLDGNDNNFIITQIDFGAGDSHQQGKSVGIIQFNYKYHVVYKPHHLKIDTGFQTFCKWLNEQKINGYLQLQTPIVFTTKEYGWTSYVSYKSCEDEQQMLNYYHRIGHLLALLYLFDAKDFHHENLIAHGEIPILIDLETLFHGTVVDSKNDLSTQLMENSVLETMLLPRRIQLTKDRNKVVDISGVSGFTEQECPLLVPTIINQLRSDMKIIYTNPIITPEKNIPKIEGQELSKIQPQYVDQIVSGFSSLYDWIMLHKQETNSIIMDSFNESHCRLILKSTNIYATLLRLGTHPDLHVNPINKEVFLCRIALSNITKKSRLLSFHEHQDLMNGDVPYFYTIFNKTDIYNSKQDKIKGVKLISTPAQNFKKRLNAMCEKDKQLQIKLIDLSFIHSLPLNHITTNYELADAICYDRDEILQLAQKTGKVIADNSILLNNDCTWVGIELDKLSEEMTCVSTLSPDLYKGLAGIALFFSCLYKITQLNEYELYTRAVCHQLVHTIEPLTIKDFKNLKKIDNQGFDIGGFTGVGSVLYALYHISLNINDVHYHKIVIDKVMLIYKAHIIDSKMNKDIIGGISGYVMMLLSIYEHETDAIIKEKLEKIILDLEVSLHDISKIDGEGYTGFAHGTSGAIATLIRINSHFPDDKRIISIKQLLDHERSLFDKQEQNWYTKEDGTSKAVGWCNGATGILLSRVLLKKYNYSDDLIDNEIDIAVQSVLNKGFGNNITLCHGDTGNAIVLMEYIKIIKNEDVKEKLNIVCHKIVHYLKENIDKTLYKTIDFYGLMIGKSGEGYFLLKLLQDDIGNILFLE